MHTCAYYRSRGMHIHTKAPLRGRQLETSPLQMKWRKIINSLGIHAVYSQALGLGKVSLAHSRLIRLLKEWLPERQRYRHSIWLFWI